MMWRLLSLAVLVGGCSVESPEVQSAPEKEQVEAAASTPARDPVKAAPVSRGGAPALPEGACNMQAGSKLPVIRLRAIGTEPFWGARIEGRCVTYSHPDDQAGTRVWTSFSGSGSKGTWTGALNRQPFVLRTAPESGCSDGMSDQRYPIAVALTVMGEERRGCAEPL